MPTDRRMTRRAASKAANLTIPELLDQLREHLPPFAPITAIPDASLSTALDL